MPSGHVMKLLMLNRLIAGYGPKQKAKQEEELGWQPPDLETVRPHKGRA